MAYRLKIAIVGESFVGKTSLLKNFIDGEKPSPQDIPATIGVDFFTKTLERDVNDTRKQVQVQLWDTAGHERFRTITPNFFRQAQGIIVCYDITDRKTYEDVDFWLNELRTHAASDVVTCMAGNKLDLVEEKPEKRSVSTVEAEELAKRCSVDYFHETSAITGKNVEEMFLEIVDVVLARLMQAEEEEEARDEKRKLAEAIHLTSSNKPINNQCRC